MGGGMPPGPSALGHGQSGPVVEGAMPPAGPSGMMPMSMLPPPDGGMPMGAPAPPVGPPVAPEMGAIGDVGMPQQVAERRHNVTVMETTPDGKVVWDKIDQQDFLFDSHARNLNNFHLVGDIVRVRAWELLAQGFDMDAVYDLIEVSQDKGSDTTAKFNIRGNQQRTNYRDESAEDKSMIMLELTECYMRMDIEGTGVPLLYRFIVGGEGEGRKILLQEPVSEVPYAVFELLPTSENFIGDSIAKDLFDDHDLLTSLKRECNNSISAVNNPRPQIIDGQVNVQDLKNQEVGGIIRQKMPNAVSYLQTPVTSAHAIEAMQLFHRHADDRTGVNSVGTGMNPSALHNVTASAMDLAVDSSMGPMEIMTRNLMDGGVIKALQLVYNLTIQNQSGTVKLFDVEKGVGEVDPRGWNPDMRLRANVGIGKGSKHRQKEALQSLIEMQASLKDRPDMVRVSSKQIYNALADMLSSNGIFNPSRYFTAISEEEERAMEQAKAQAQQDGAGGEAAYLQGEQIKAQTEAGKAQIRAQIDAQKLMIEDDRKRDEFEAKILVEMIKNGINPQMVLQYIQRPRHQQEVAQ